MWHSSRSSGLARRPGRRAGAAACAAATAAALWGVPQPAAAQTARRFAFDSVLSSDVFTGENVSRRPQVIVDLSGAVRLGDHAQLYVRPWFRLPRPNSPNLAAPPWSKELWQAGIRHERPWNGGRLATRVDAGYNVSPLGLGVLDTRANLNPTIAPHVSYLIPMPVFDVTTPRVSPIAATYPLGAQVTVSSAHWDARGAVVNSAPTRVYALGRATSPRQTPALVLGGGVTPLTGLRLGVSFARGRYATAQEVTGPVQSDRTVAIVGAEGELAFGYTRLGGEVVRSRFERLSGTAVAYTWFVQGVQVVAPRWFVAARHEGTAAPPLAGVGAGNRLTVVETTIGFRAAPDVTLRGSYYTRRSYGAPSWDHQAGISAVWARKWW